MKQGHHRLIVANDKVNRGQITLPVNADALPGIMIFAFRDFFPLRNNAIREFEAFSSLIFQFQAQGVLAFQLSISMVQVSNVTQFVDLHLLQIFLCMLLECSR